MMNEVKKKLLLIFNPYAASKRASKLLKPIIDEFKKYDIEVVVRITRFRKDAVSIVLNEDFLDYSGIVAAGGDGTLFEVVNGYFRKTPLP